jgi:hypothetical protein
VSSKTRRQPEGSLVPRSLPGTIAMSVLQTMVAFWSIRGRGVSLGPPPDPFDTLVVLVLVG